MKIRPNLEILPEAQSILWPLLKDIPQQFVLYGGTAIALHYGHRQSVDFDFFTTSDFDAEYVQALPFIKKYFVGAKRHSDTFYDIFLDVKDVPYVKVTFVKTTELLMPGSINAPDQFADNNIKTATPLDLMVGKLYAVQDRAEPKDYIDLSVLVENGVSLQDGFEAAYAIGQFFPPGGVSQTTLLRGVKNALSEKSHVGKLLAKYPQPSERTALLVKAACQIDLGALGKSGLRARRYLDMLETTE